MTGETNPQPPRWQWQDLVTVTLAGTLQQADVLRARLAMDEIDAYVPNENTTTWAWHMQRAIQPGGIPLMVPPEQVDRALAVLTEIGQPSVFDEPPAKGDEPDATESAEEEQPSSPDQYAASALRSAMLAWMFWPLSVLALHYFLKALGARQLAAVENPRTFRRRMLAALLAGFVPLSVVIVLAAQARLSWLLSRLLVDIATP